MARLPGMDLAASLLQARGADALVEAANQVAAAAGQVAVVAGEAAATLAGAAGGAAGTAATAASGLAGDAVQDLAALARGGRELVVEARETVRAFHRLALRADALVAELEEPLRELAPGLRKLAVVLEDPVVEQLPATVRQVQEDVLPVLRALAETQQRMSQLAGLPGAALLGMRRPPSRGTGSGGQPA